MSADPYRAPTPSPGERLHVYPALSLPRMVALLLLGVTPVLMQVFLWSSVVEIRCTKAAAAAVSCDVEETSLGLTRRTRVALIDPRHARVEGSVDRSRGDVWIEVASPTSTIRLTRGLNLHKESQRRIAADLTAFFHDGSSHFVGSFGSRWSTAPIAIVCFALALGIFLYLWRALRLTMVRREHPGTLTVELRSWPRPSRYVAFDPRAVRGVESVADHLFLGLASGDRIELARCHPPRRAAALAARLDAFVKAGPLR